jgi:predicted DNA-binding transcriptional regulator YafY
LANFGITTQDKIMRASRLLSILILLQLRVKMTAESLAREYEVSVRTIYRDIDSLSAAGVPVYGDRGPGGGFQLLDGYRTKLTGLDSGEAEALMMIGLPEPAAALGLGVAAGRAKAKLLAALTAEGSAGAERIAGRFHLDPVDWYRTAEPVRYLPAITRAVLDQQSLEISYESWAGLRDRIVDPLGLVLKAGNWYLVARIDGDFRTYRVSNIQTLMVQETVFQRPADFDLAAHWATQLVRFETDLRLEIAELSVSAKGCKSLSALDAYAVDALAKARPSIIHDWTDVSLPFENLDQVARVLLGLGPEFIVVKPVALRERIEKLCANILTHMQETKHV